MRWFRSLRVRLFLSYLGVIVVATGATFITARALAPTLFRSNLEHGRPADTPTGSTFGPGGPSTSSGSTLGPGEPTATSGSTFGPGGSSTVTAGSTLGPGGSGDTGSTVGPGGPTLTSQPTAGPGGAGSTVTGSTRGQGGSAPAPRAPSQTISVPEDLGSIPTVQVGGAAIAQTVVDERVNEAFRSAVNTALTVALVVSVVAAGVFAAFVSRRIVLPIGRVRAATLRLAAGHYAERVPVPSEEELAGLARDVNRLAATLEETEQKRARLMSDVAHELRTPLTTIQGSMEGLIDGVLEPSDELFASVADEAARLQRVVADLGLLSRIDESALTMSLAPLDLAGVAQAVASRLRPQFVDKGVRLELACPDRLQVSGDGDRLSQVFTNLMGNALGHTGEGGSVRITGREAEGWVEVTVGDTGEGIGAKDLERIFDRFYRVEGSEHHGTGLGLTIARSIVRAHGGDVVARSPGRGHGSEFTVRIPALRPRAHGEHRTG